MNVFPEDQLTCSWPEVQEFINQFLHFVWCFKQSLFIVRSPLQAQRCVDKNMHTKQIFLLQETAESKADTSRDLVCSEMWNSASLRNEFRAKKFNMADVYFCSFFGTGVKLMLQPKPHCNGGSVAVILRFLITKSEKINSESWID